MSYLSSLLSLLAPLHAKTGPRADPLASLPSLHRVPLSRTKQAVSLTFSIKYLSNFAKSTPLSDYVHVSSPSSHARPRSLSADLPRLPPAPSTTASHVQRSSSSRRVPLWTRSHPLLLGSQNRRTFTLRSTLLSSLKPKLTLPLRFFFHHSQEE